jgi:hypothetical protein
MGKEDKMGSAEVRGKWNEMAEKQISAAAAGEEDEEGRWILYRNNGNALILADLLSSSVFGAFISSKKKTVEKNIYLFYEEKYLHLHIFWHIYWKNLQNFVDLLNKSSTKRND